MNGRTQPVRVGNVPSRVRNVNTWWGMLNKANTHTYTHHPQTVMFYEFKCKSRRGAAAAATAAAAAYEMYTDTGHLS